MQDDRKRFLFTESVAYVFQDPISSLLTNMACGALLCLLLLSAIRPEILITWLLVLLMVSIARLAIAKLYEKQIIRKPQNWYLLYFSGTLISALVWGLTPVWFFVDETLQYQFFLVAVLAGVVAGAGYSQAPFRMIYGLYTSILMGPVIVRFFIKVQVDFLTFVIALIFLVLAIFFNNRRMYRVLMSSLELRYEINQMAITDSLTGLANRRHFDQFFFIEWQRAQRHKLHISLLMIDVDHFKKFNDIYGHLSGDQCLQQIARAIKNCTHRASDLAVRYGGEEFMVVLPHTPIEGAITVAGNIRRVIADLKIPHEGSDVGRNISVSVGISVIIPELFFTPEHLINAADKALYQAKRAGRDRISIYNNLKNVKAAS